MSLDAMKQALEVLSLELPIGSHLELKSALRAAIEQAERLQTHSEECWRWHHQCAVAKIERMQIAIEGLARIGRNAVDQIIKLEKTK